MAKKSGKPEKNDRDIKKKPESGRAFLFGSKKGNSDEFIGDGGLAIDEQTEPRNTNSFLLDDLAGAAEADIKKGGTEEAAKESTVADSKTKPGSTAGRETIKQKTEENAKFKKSDVGNKEDKEKNKEENAAGQSEDIKKKHKSKDRQKGLASAELQNKADEPQPQEAQPSEKEIISEETKAADDSKKQGLFGQGKKRKEKKVKKERDVKQKKKPDTATKDAKSVAVNKPVVPKNAADELEAIKKKQKKAAKKISRKLSSPFAAAGLWIKKILPAKGKNNALKFAQTVSSKKTKKTKRILIYSGAGVLAAAIALVFIFVPFGRNGDTQADDIDETDSVDMAYALTEQTGTPTPTKTVIPTTSVTQTPIVTTEPDPTHKTINVDSMVDDCMVDANLYYNEVGYSNNYYEYTENEMYILAQLIHGEARGESLDGMVAVGNVVMNRVLNRRYFGNTILAVVTASGQFSGYKSTIIPSSKCKIAARKVLDYQVWVVPQNIYYFKAYGAAGVDWGSHKFYKRIGGHNFYIHRYGGRSNTDKIPPRMYERTYKWPRMGCWPEDRIYRVQYMLNKLGYNVIADSYFGVGTMKELKKFQEKKGLETDGVAGPSTIEALIRAFGVEEYYEKFYT